MVGRRSEVGVDGGFDEVRAKDIGDGLEENGKRGGDGGELVRRKIAEETAHQGAVVDFANHIVVGSPRGSSFLFFLFGHCCHFRGCEARRGFRLA